VPKALAGCPYKPPDRSNRDSSRRFVSKAENVYQGEESAAERTMSQDLTEIVAELLALAPKQVSDDMGPSNTASWDSLATVNLIVAVETRYAIQLDLDELMAIENVGALRKILADKGIAA